MANTTKLTNLQALAVAKSLKEAVVKEARATVSPGVYDIDVTVRIVGTVTVGEAYHQRFVGAVPWELLALMAMDRLNAASRTAIIETIHDAQQNGTLPEALEDARDRAKDEVLGTLEALKDATEKEVAGKVNTSLAVLRV